MPAAVIAETANEKLRRECPNRDNHADEPRGYLQWHAWAEAKNKTHRQRKCGGCGLYVIWTPR